ncbi:MAG: hypothetical protein IT445_12125 [Phycisphaeraceae bacterium]|nr:hypothetical protein [Phycisphaeraceae bacterium]
MPPRRKITSYRLIPPRMRIIYSESDQPMTVDRYLKQMDAGSEPAGREPTDDSGGAGLVSYVFTQQINQRADESRQLAHLVVARQALADKHLRDIRHRQYQLRERVPFRATGPGFIDDHTLTEVERTIFDLEKQERLVETKLWSDLVDLRQSLITKRGEYRAISARWRYLGGSYDVRE